MPRPLSPAVQKLIDAYGKELPSRLQNLHEQAPSDDNREALEQYGGDIHKIAGSSGSYGFREISEALRKLDRYIADCLAGENTYERSTDRELWQAVFAEMSSN